MRESLKELIKNTIVFEYELAHVEKSIKKTIYSTDNDHCYSSLNNKDISEIIYNALIEYAFNQHELNETDYNNLHSIALKTKIKFDETKEIEDQGKYGFFGEVMLHCLLCIMYKTTPLIAKGYFYNPLENSELKGYDSYHIIEHDNKLELWFGEVKFHAVHTSGIDDVLKKIDNSISDNYLNKNLMALPNHENNLNIQGSKVDLIIKEWKKKPEIKILEEAKKYSIKLVYPILLLFNESSSGYDDSIRNVIKYIEDNYSPKAFNISVEISIFFILLPVKNTKEIKTTVLQWIKDKKQLMS